MARLSDDSRGKEVGRSLIVSKSFCGAAVAVCVLNFGTLISYSVDLVARQQLASALEWASLKEKDGAGLAEPVG